MQTKHMVLVVLAVVAVAGCTHSGPDAGNGSFELLISDRPAAIDDFGSLTVTFDEARVFPAGENASMETIDISGKQVDLTQVKGAKAASLVNTSLAAGTYTKIELSAENVEGVVNGSSVDVKLPSEKLQLTKPFTVGPNTTTSFVFDIQVVLRGNAQHNQGYILKPVISESGVAGEDVEVERSSGKPEDAGRPEDADNNTQQ